MRRIGMLGGMSWESSLEYYRLINENVKRKLGVTHSANCIMYSFDFDEIEKLQHKDDWKTLTNRMVEEAVNLKNAGAESIVICTNTMHKMADDIEKVTGLEVIHIAEVTAREVKRRGIKKVLLIGTKFTMEGDFYTKRLNEVGIEVVIPNSNDREIIHNVIYNELILGKIEDESRREYIKTINHHIEIDDIGGVILGCTEIPLLIKDKDVKIEVFDTTEIHCLEVTEWMIAKS